MLDGTKLKFLRYMNGRTQKQIAEWCGCSVRYIKFIESNEMIPSEELYSNFINGIYKIGKPAPKKQKKKESEE